MLDNLLQILEYVTKVIKKLVGDFFDGLVAFLEAAYKLIKELVSDFFDGLVEFLEAAYKWLVKVITNIVNYLIRFIPAFIKVLFVLFQLSLFFIPTIICTIFYFSNGNFLLLLGAIIWGISITAIGLIYRNKP